jgi:autotransporter-associated beta strand protein
LKASGDNASFMTNLTTARIYSGGATIDDGGHAIGIGQVLSDATGYGVVSISVDTPGAGYLDAPVVTISGGSGINATAIAQVDPSAGTVTNILVTCPGSGYNNGDVLTITLSGGGATTAATVGSTVSFAANASGVLTKAGTGTLTLSGANTYTGNTVVSNGTLLVNGSLAGATAVQGGMLGGTGTIGGSVTVNPAATLAPGSGGSGTLTINGNVTLNAGSTNTFTVDGTTPANTSVAANAAVTYGGVLNIVSSGTFTNGQTFTLFSGPGAASASNFTSIMGSPGNGLDFSFTNGVLSVVADVGPSGPGNLTNSYDASTHTLSLSWPSGQGWRLQIQTNSLSIGLSTNWTYITDGSVSNTNITVDPTLPTVFYRLRNP